MYHYSPIFIETCGVYRARCTAVFAFENNFLAKRRQLDNVHVESEFICNLKSKIRVLVHYLVHEYNRGRHLRT